MPAQERGLSIVFSEPLEQTGKAGGGKSYARIGAAIVQPHGVPMDQPAAGENDLVYISEDLIALFRAEDPLVGPGDHPARILQVQQSQTEAVYRTAGCGPDAVVED